MFRFSLIVAVVAVVASVGCGAGSPTSPRAETPGARRSAFAGWRSWKRVTPRLFSRAHGRKYVEVWVEPTFAEAYASGQVPFPVGLKVAKVAFRDAESDEVVLVNGMEKRAHYDPDDHDWYYEVLDAAGRTRASGRIGMCIDCHSMAEELDYLYRPQGTGSWKHGWPARNGSAPARP